jgi:acetoin utilization protein AcuB
MTPEPIVVDPDDSIGLAADIFLVNTLHALPVVEDNRLVGIITTHDLLKYAFAEAV